MDDFFNEIKNNVNPLQEGHFPSSAWEDFSQYRNERDRSSKSRRSFWLPLLLFGVLGSFLFSNIYWFTKFQDVQTTSHTVTRDTVYITQFAQSPTPVLSEANYETLSTTGILNQEQTQQSLLNERKLQYALQEIRTLKGQLTSLSVQKLKIGHAYSNAPKTAFSQRTALNPTPELIQLLEPSNDATDLSRQMQNLYSNDHNGPFCFLDLTHLHPIELVNQERILSLDLAQPVKKLKERKFFKAIQPKSISINMNGGYLHGLDNKYGKSNGISAGLKFSTQFSDIIRGNMGIMGNTSKSQVTNGASSPDIPTVIPPENAILKGIYAQNKRIVVTADIEHILFPSKTWRPYYGIGYVLELDSKYRYDFEYNTPAGESSVRTEAVPESMSRQFISLTGGLEYDFNSSWSGTLRGTYFQSFKGEAASYLYFGPGVYYHF